MIIDDFKKISLENDQVTVMHSSLNDFGNHPNKPGLYSWHVHLRGNSKLHLSHLFQSYQSDEYKAVMNGRFEMAYSGVLTNQSEMEFKDGIADEKILKICSALFAPPIYIGLSYAGVRNRLEQHIKAFNSYKSHINLNDIETPLDRENDGRLNVDSEEESNIFGVRLAKIFALKKNGLSTNDIFIKSVTFDEEFEDTKFLYDIERYLNKTYCPLLGIK